MRTEASLSSLIRIPQAIAGESTYDGVLKAMAGELRAILPFDHIDIVMLVAEGREHVCYETPVQTVWSTLANAPQPTGRSPVRSVLSGTVPHILTEDAFTDERFHFDGALDQPIFQAILRSRVIVPLRVRNMVFGSVNISRQNTAAYGPADLQVGQDCADLVAPYLFALMAGRKLGRDEGLRETDELRARLLRFTTHLERERRRLGMDLHDQTVADLSHIARKLASVERGGPALGPVLNQVQADVHNCLTELRRIVEDAVPAVLELFGFVDALEDVMRKSQAVSAVPMDVTLDDLSDGAADRLSDVGRMLLFRIAQEAINNAARHSGGSLLSVRLERCGGDLVLTVEDDGSGRVNLRSTRGLSHMRSRAALIRAKINFTPGRTGRGTRVQVRLPTGEPYPVLRH